MGTLRASAVMPQLAGLAAVALVCLAVRSPLGMGAAFAVKSSAIFALVTLLAAAFLDRHHPFATFGPANHVTTARAALVAMAAGAIGEPPTPGVAAAAVSAGLVATLLDGVDGWLARRSRMTSPFGARFDMEVDALLIFALAALAWEHGKAGWWVIASGLLRYAFVAAAWGWPWLASPLPPSRRRQTICVAQIVALLIVVSPVVEPPVSTSVAAASLGLLAGSFLVDTLWLWRGIHDTSPAYPHEAAKTTKPLVS